MPINDVRPDQEGEFAYVNTSGAIVRGDGGTVSQSGTGNTHIKAAGGVSGIFNDTTFDGSTGSTGYTIGDVVKALKNLGLLAS